MVEKIRLSQSRSRETSFLIVDAQSVKNSDSAEQKGYDAGKKISGIKRHIAVDTNGFPHFLEITTANISDRDGAVFMLGKFPKRRFKSIKNMLFDGGYRGEKFAKKIKKMCGSPVEIVKRNELHEFVVLPKRWLVERSFGWLEKCRRLWKNCERKLESSRAMMQIAFISLLVKRF